MIRTIFVAGVYGVGKDYLCNKISNFSGIKNFSASQLISNINNENYVKNKSVKNIDDNQSILIREVSRLLKECKSIILTGHMCILNANMEIEELPSSVFNGLEITNMVLLKNDSDTIKQNLMKRDNKNYSLKLIEDFQKAEEEAFLITAQNIGAKSKIIDLMYDNSDVIRFQIFLEE